jgi:hypothetical protein
MISIWAAKAKNESVHRNTLTTNRSGIYIIGSHALKAEVSYMKVWFNLKSQLLGRQRQEDHEFEANLWHKGIKTLSQKQNKNENKATKK